MKRTMRSSRKSTAERRTITRRRERSKKRGKREERGRTKENNTNNWVSVRMGKKIVENLVSLFPRLRSFVFKGERRD